MSDLCTFHDMTEKDGKSTIHIIALKIVTVEHEDKTSLSHGSGMWIKARYTFP